MRIASMALACGLICVCGAGFTAEEKPGNDADSAQTRKPPAAAGNVTGTPKDYEVVGVGTLRLDVPAGWTDTVTRAIRLGVPVDEIQFGSARGTNFGVLVSLVHQTPEEVRTFDVQGTLRALAMKQLPAAVEKSVDLKPFNGGEISGYYVSLTDRTVPDTNQKPGEFKYLTQGYAPMKGVIMGFRVVANGSPAETRDTVIEMLKNARIVKP